MYGRSALNKLPDAELRAARVVPSLLPLCGPVCRRRGSITWGRRPRMTEGEEPQDRRDSQVALMTAVAQQRDKSAFQDLFRHFAPRLQAFLQGTGSDLHAAEEIVQETMVNAWRKAHLFDPTKAAVSTWIFTIARNARTDHLRRANRPEPDMNDPAAVPDPEPQPHDIVSREQEAKRLQEIVARLPEEQQAVLRLAFVDEKTHAIVAEELGIPLGTVKSRIRLAIGHLRSALGEQE